MDAGPVHPFLGPERGVRRKSGDVVVGRHRAVLLARGIAVVFGELFTIGPALL